EREIPIADFHRLPGSTPNVDTNLKDDELITAVDLPTTPFAARSHYLKVRDRASYAFAIVSVAAAIEIDVGKKITAARIALGGEAAPASRSLASSSRAGRGRGGQHATARARRGLGSRL